MKPAIKVISLDAANKKAVIEVLGKQQEVNAYLYGDRADIYGLAVRIGRTGLKVWQARATYWIESGNVNNISALSLDRMNQRGVYLVGFWSDVPEAARSQR